METANYCVVALGSVESNDNSEAWGDNGRAMGRWQVHPDRLVDEARRNNLWPTQTDSYDTWVYAILLRMFRQELPRRTPAMIAMYWHVGHWVTAYDAEWDDEYANQFMAALARVQL